LKKPKVTRKTKGAPVCANNGNSDLKGQALVVNFSFARFKKTKSHERDSGVRRVLFKFREKK